MSRLPDRSFWAGKRVLVTGHTGFKGSWLTMWLSRLGTSVTGVSLAPHTDPSLFEAASVGRICHDRRADIRDVETLRAIVRDARPEIVFHLAAQAIVKEGYEEPVETFAANVQGTVHLLDALRGVEEVRSVVIVTSDKCYENTNSHVGYREGQPLGGSDPYSASKACAELVTAAYRRSYFDPAGVPVSSARAGNVVGGGDWSRDRLVPDVMHSLLSETSLYVRRPQAIRPWQHVLEPLRGYLVLAQSQYSDPRLGQSWNFAPADDAAVSVQVLIDGLMCAWGTKAEVTKDTREHPPEHDILLLDASKARDALGVSPLLSIRETCEWTAAWYKRWSDGENARALCYEQIERYAALPDAAVA